MLTAAIALGSTGVWGLGQYVGRHLLFGLVSVLLVLSCSIVPYRVLVNPVTRFLGKVSYSVYLVHFAVRDAATGGLRRVFDGLPGTPGTVKLVVYFAVILGASTVLASLTYRLVEQPGINFGRTLIRGLDRRRAAIPV